ncbi:diguanylate cyclase domain-containing protein [Modestobacter versicolor]|uniref:diguanylate cyclase domain-containing protein n=1 Tax=Modestobacter versicolor TaxID=429133 RepID=UPI0034DFBF2B
MLVAVAGRLRELAGPDDVVARLGGDEFLLPCPGASETALADRAGRLQVLMAQPVDVAGGAVRAGVSTGTAVGRSGDDPGAVMALADRDMYRAKSSSRVRRRSRAAAPG